MAESRSIALAILAILLSQYLEVQVHRLHIVVQLQQHYSNLLSRKAQVVQS